MPETVKDAFGHWFGRVVAILSVVAPLWAYFESREADHRERLRAIETRITVLEAPNAPDPRIAVMEARLHMLDGDISEIKAAVLRIEDKLDSKADKR